MATSTQPWAGKDSETISPVVLESILRKFDDASAKRLQGFKWFLIFVPLLWAGFGAMIYMLIGGLR